MGIAKIVGPSVIVLGMGIGAGEWLLAPAAAVRFGVSILWIATIAIIIQTLAFIEATRYTLYTGEPLTTGIMRLKPGPLFWGPLLLVLLVLSLGWPVWAFGAATAIVSAYLGRLSGPQDANLVIVVGFLLAMIVLAILAFGGVVVRVLEKAEWAMMFLVIAVLIILTALVVPGARLLDIVRGFISFGSLPDVSLLEAAILLGAVAGYAGAGSFANTVISSYYRDKGFGMARYSGAITTLVGGASVALSSTGAVFNVTEENLRRWNEWKRIAVLDIVGIFTLGSFIGILLPVALAVTLIPQGTDIAGWAAAAYQGERLRALIGFAGWATILVLGFWILFSTQMGLMELVARTATDILWAMSSRLRELTKGDVRFIYYPILAFIAVWITASFILFYKFKVNPVLAAALVANMSNLVYPLTVLANLYLNNKYLPKEIRPSPLITIALLLGCVFWLSFFTLFLLSLIR